MRNNDKATCSSCRYFDDVAELCRRYAPRPVRYVVPYRRDLTDSVDRTFPTVDPMDWCGEWESLEE